MQRTPNADGAENSVGGPSDTPVQGQVCGSNSRCKIEEMLVSKGRKDNVSCKRIPFYSILLQAQSGKKDCSCESRSITPHRSECRQGQGFRSHQPIQPAESQARQAVPHEESDALLPRNIVRSGNCVPTR